MARYWLLTFLLLATACARSAENSGAAVTEVMETAVTPIPNAAVTQPTVDESDVSLAGLPLNQFFDHSYKALLMRDPERITEAGLVDIYNGRNDQLTNISAEYIAETQALEQDILDLLHTYNRAELSPDEQLSYDIYEWYLADAVARSEFTYNDYPVSFLITSVHVDTIQFFSDIHPVTNQQDIEDYITRLGQVGTKFEQLIAGLQLREDAGVILPRFAIQWTLPGVQQIARSSPQNTPFYTTLRDKMLLLSSVHPDDQTALLDVAEQEIAHSVIPAFQALADKLNDQLAIATNDDGVWKFPNGMAYYNFTLRHFSTTEMTAEEIHALGLEEVARIQDGMRLLFDELGYPEDETLPQLMERVVAESGLAYGDEIVVYYENLIDQAAANIGDAFSLRPQADVIVVGAPAGGYYVRPAVDGSRPGAFYAAVQGSEPLYGMPTLAYHEAIPGHHFQLAIMQELTGLPAFRNGVSFTAYTEGWALYAEQLAYELGFYEDDPYGNIGRLQAELFRAVRLVVDTGIHAQGWTFDEAVAYMMANTGYPRRMVEGQIARYIVWPGQAVAYKIGMMKILELRQRAQLALGDDFDLKTFHDVILQNGSMPLAILEQVVQQYINETLQ